MVDIDEDKKKELQNKYIQLQVVRQQLNAFMEEKTNIDTRVNELNMTIETLEKLAPVKNEEMWSAVGSGAFVKSGIKDADDVMISIGAGVVLREKRAIAIGILKERLDEIVDIEKKFSAEVQKLGMQGEKLEQELEEMASELE